MMLTSERGYGNALKDYVEITRKEFATHIRDSLVREVGQKKIDPKFFYDDKGSRIFEEICLQPQYYPTRTEIEILKRSTLDIVSNLNCTSASVIEFGSGSSLKTRLLLRQFLKQGISVVYFPIDISQTALISSVQKISLEFKNLGVIAISSDYLGGLDKISNLIDASNSIPTKKVMFFLGSSIGNFEPDETESFLRSIRSTMRTETQDNLFISFDLEKDIEMFIVSKCDQEVYIKNLDETVSLKKGERIHTENSYKYTKSQIKRLAEKSGFLVKKNYMDRNRWFDLVSLVPT